MERYDRRTVRFVCLILTLLLLVSCSHISHSPTQREEEKEEPIVLHYASYLLNSAQASKVYYDAISEFEQANPGIKIEADFIMNANYTAGIKIRLLGGEKLDVFDVWSPSLFEELRLLNPDLYLELTDKDFLAQFLPNTLLPVTIQGKIYGAPEVMHSDGLLYNRTLFEQHGWKVPTTWSEFIALCEQISALGIIPIATDAEWSTSQFFWGSIMSNNGADKNWTKRLENGEIKITDETFVDAIQKHREIIDRGFVPDNWMSLKHEQSKDLVGQGKAAMIITGTWSITSVMERNPDYDIDFMNVPGEERTVPNINIGTYRVINAKTNHPEEARKFITFMNGRATQEKLAEGAVAVPSVKEASLSSKIVTRLARVVTRNDATFYWPHTVSTESLQVKIQESVNKYLLGGALDLTLHEIQEVIDRARENRGGER